MPRHIVIDQNVFRWGALLQPAIDDARAHGDCVLVTDMALAEMMKADQWEATTRRSLQLLAEVPDLVVAGKAIGPLMSEEHDTGAPCTEVVDDEVTARLRALLGEVRGQQDGPLFAHVRTVIEEARALAAAQHFEHTRNRESLTNVVAGWKASLREDELRAVRREDDAAIQAILESGSMQATCFQALVGAGYDREKAAALTCEPSVSAHEFLAYVALGLRWCNGNIEEAPQELITNDLADKDYVVIASFCRGIISRDARVNQLHARLTRIVAARARFFQAIAAAAS